MEVSELVGKVLTKVVHHQHGDDEIAFTCENGDEYKLYHQQDCCENVFVEDIAGDL